MHSGRATRCCGCERIARRAASHCAIEACAVSDPLACDRPPEHRGYYSRVAPNGERVNLGLAPAAVLASTAAIADALTKCVLLCSRDEALLKRTLLHFGATAIELDEGNGEGG